MPGDLTIFNMCTIYEDHMMYGSWDIMCDRVFYHFVLFFALLPPNNPQNQNFDKMKKPPGDIIILQIHTINYNHMMYGS